MHEVSIVSDLFEIIQENIVKHELKAVTKVVLKIGEMTCVEEHAIRFAFEAMAKDTEVERAELIIDKVKATAKCESCGEIFAASFLNKICPKCSLFSGHILTGYELYIDELEGE